MTVNASRRCTSPLSAAPPPSPRPPATGLPFTAGLLPLEQPGLVVARVTVQVGAGT